MKSFGLVTFDGNKPDLVEVGNDYEKLRKRFFDYTGKGEKITLIDLKKAVVKSRRVKSKVTPAKKSKASVKADSPGTKKP